MGLTLYHFEEDACCLCGSKERLTGEHKIKASTIRAEFGNQPLILMRGGEPHSARQAQGPKSTAFHFEAKLCNACNSQRTQPADKEFDRFHAAVREAVDRGLDARSVFETTRYVRGSATYLNVFRYFAKLLCCHMAEAQGPRLRHISAFARGSAGRNCIWLQIDNDWSYQNLQSAFGDMDYAAHGGLVIYANRKRSEVRAFHSTRTIGPIRYIFWHRLTVWELLGLRLGRSKLTQNYKGLMNSALAREMTDDERLEFGVSSGGEA